MKSRLDRLESRLQAAIERHLPWGRSENALETAKKQLSEAARANQSSQNGEVFYPDDLTLYLPPTRLDAWQAQPDLLAGLTEFMRQEAARHQAGYGQPVTIRLAVDPNLHATGMRVQADFRPENLEHTATLPLEPEPQAEPSKPDGSDSLVAFLILYGNEVYPLDQAVVNIGRRPDNTLVIDDGRVSRSHAQIRNIQGSYVLFDLNSTGGTYVNNERITQCSLQPGDVISFAGVQLIYGVDSPPASHPSGSTSQINTKPS